MKVKILFLMLLFGLNQLGAQSIEKTAKIKASSSMFKQPKGFVYIPQQNTSPAFFVMKEPVTIKEFNEFQQKLFRDNNIMDANTCKLAIPNDHYKPTNYLILSNPAPIDLYAKFLSQKLSDSTYIVKCYPLTESMWKLMKGPVKLDSIGSSKKDKKNPYGLIFFTETDEFRTNSKGEFMVISDNHGYQRGTFRLALTYIQRKTITKK